jgi:CAP-Gly domain-containing linker protein 1
MGEITTVILSCYFSTANRALSFRKQYFICPPNCGVFVATTKLSPPTVGPGSVYRPSSVASSRSGRITPSLSATFSSGITTSRSSGRVTPSTSGRVTPSHSYGKIPGATPGRPRIPAMSKTAASQSNNVDSLTSKITAGSRASKYVSMTAKQLKSRPVGESTPPRKGHENDSSGPNPLGPSPSRHPPSPFTTPRQSLSARTSNIGTDGSSSTLFKGRTSMNTPRARIPSSVAMPPPPSPSRPPSSPSRSMARNDLSADLSFPRLDGSATLESPTSHGSFALAEKQADIERLQSRLDALEYENERLRSAAAEPNVTDLAALSRQTDQAEQDQSLLIRIAELEERVQVAEVSYNDRSSLADSLQNAVANLERQREEGRQRLEELEARLAESVASVENLSTMVKLKEAGEKELNSILLSKNADLAAFEEQVKMLYAKFDDERRELGGQIDELRQAGQVGSL